eukprot:CAMPEP_0183294828 /NCGR_PEP_ID=MMETSP0160_2-20130417/2999_1 /TAXON_ID=2839 ORGANISM="Odontella Sinensis, Strain Grunow 1884" /NCGR_SAMPLE_ID=MMETSP0160_2 /ASSEMBLY_ACC=CAM_ASM_000250 /LENGTH=521 /DNA_ID=CAMNT_0025456199 /DNA_START=96 /DNA_END=1661 /DNA_ORIENTATION=+
MGRITIFALTECPHCKRTKAALRQRDIPYTEINLNSYPAKRADMLALADRLTVPQVFFNKEHIGGADDTLALLEKWDKEALYPTPLERYQKEIESEPDPDDERLAVPSTPPVEETPPPPRNEEEDAVEIPGSDGKKVSVLELTKQLMKILPRSEVSHNGKQHKNAFKGSDGIDAFMKEYGIETREEAINFGRMLQKKQMLHHVSNRQDFDDDKHSYRLQPFQKSTVLNSFRVWTERVEEDYMGLVVRLKKLIGKVESNATDDNGNVDYLSAADDPNYYVFEEAVCELQGVKLGSMDEPTKVAFGINVYNMMIIHAFIKVGIPTSTVQRGSFFGKVSYDIGGAVLTFSELENGILRANAKAPYSLSRPFSSSDTRASLAVKEVDPRIHFGLNCGAKSCPPVKKFTAEAIEEELRIVALAFCEQDENVKVDEDKHKLYLSMILSWYKEDFVKDSPDLPQKVVTYLRGEKKEKLQRMIESKKSIVVKFNEYDWSTNASKSKKYDHDTLYQDGTVVGKFFRKALF